jgi:hypothetical protein
MPITLVGQAGVGGQTTTSPQTITYSSAAGNTLIAVCYLFNNSTGAAGLTSVTDSAGNTWQFSTATSSNPPFQQAATNSVLCATVAWCIGAAAVTSITVTRSDPAGTMFWRVAVAEYAGILALDTAGGNTTGTASAASVSTTLTLASAGDLVVCAGGFVNGNITAPPALAPLPAGGNDCAGGFPAAAGSYTATWTTSSSSPGALAAAAFLPSSGNPAGIVPRTSAPGSSGSGTATTITPSMSGAGLYNAGLGRAGTVPAAGDLVVIILAVAVASVTFTQTAGTGTWTIHASTNNGGATALSTMAAYRIFTGGETNPTFSWGSAARWTFAWAAFSPDPGGTLAVDAWGTDKADTTAATAHTANADTAAGGGECSVLLTGAVAGANGTNPVNFSGPPGWLTPPGGQQSNTGGSSTREYAPAVFWQQPVADTVTPGAQTVRGGTTGTGTTTANLYHLLISQSGVFLAPAPAIISQAVSRAADY